MMDWPDIGVCYFGISGTVLQWFKSYVSNRQQHVHIDGSLSCQQDLHFGVPQGSVLGPFLFCLYTTSISQIITTHDVSHHMYADDTQVYIELSQSDIHKSISSLSDCLTDISTISNALITSRLDYCNSLLNNISKQDLSKLQRVQNCLACVVLRAPRFSSSLPLLKRLHWLPDNYTLKTDDDSCMSPALEYNYLFCFVALLSSGLRGFKRHRSYIIIIIARTYAGTWRANWRETRNTKSFKESSATVSSASTFATRSSANWWDRRVTTPTRTIVWGCGTSCTCVSSPSTPAGYSRR